VLWLLPRHYASYGCHSSRGMKSGAAVVLE
jgi:hypothetical protein